MTDTPQTPASLEGDSPFEIPRLDSEKMRSTVAAKLFGGEAAPVRIGPYTVLRRLGAGGMGVVYAAFDDGLDRKIAVKVMHGRAVQKVHEDRLRREAQALAQLSHPNVVAVYEVGSFRGQVYLAMEFLPGDTLAKLKRDPAAPLKEQLDPWIQAAKGLWAAHQAGITHRDFKPANAMCLPDGRVKVFDFGLALRSDASVESTRKDADISQSSTQSPDWRTSGTTHRDESSSHPQTKTMTGALVGTPAYMSPEQHQGRRPDERSDQFSYCVALWEYLTGYLPFPGSNRSELLSSMQSGALASVPRGAMPGWLRAILVRGLALNPEDRFRSIESLLAELERGLGRRRRNRWAAAALLPVAMGAGISAYSVSRPDPCEGLAAHWEPIDPAQDLSAATAKLEERKGGFAVETFSQAIRDLQRYVQQGKSAHISACKAAMDDPKVGAAGFAAQSSCYLAATKAAKSYIQRLNVAGPKELRPGLWLSSRLPSLSSCAQVATTQESAGAQRDQIERELAQAQVDFAFFDFAKANTHAQAAIKMAQEDNAPRLVSRGWLAIAKSLEGQGEFDDARIAVDKAYRLAEQVNDIGLRLEAAVTRATVMIHQGHPQEGLSQLRDVRPLAMRPDIDSERRLGYFAAACRAPRANFRLCEAHRNCIDGLRFMENEPGSVPARNHLWRRLAWMYFEAGLIDEGLKISKRARDELLKAGGETSQLMLASNVLHLTLAGEKARLEGKNPERIKALLPIAREVHEKYVQAYGDKSTKVIHPRTNLAVLLSWAGHSDEAAPLFQALLQDHPKDPGRYYALVAYGRLQVDQGKTQAGIQTLREGLKLIQEMRSRSKHSGQSTRIPEEAEALFALASAEGKTPAGLALAKQALEVHESIRAKAIEARSKRDCAELGPGVDLYQQEREAVQAFLEGR